MKIKIYQINMDRDNGSYSFTNYENTIRRTGGDIQSGIYDCVFDGYVDCKGWRMSMRNSTLTVRPDLRDIRFRYPILWK